MSSPFPSFVKTLREVIAADFAGNQSEFARASGIAYPVCSRVVSGLQPPTHRHLTKIMPALSRESGLSLFAAWVADVLGTAEMARLFGGEGLSPESIVAGEVFRRHDLAERVIRHLRAQYMEDAESLAFLLHLGKMVGALSEEEVAEAAPQDYPLRVHDAAEDGEDGEDK